MLQRVRHLLEMIRFSHTLFALPFAILAAVMAWAANWQETQSAGFPWWDLLGIVVCMVFARSAAMAFNRLVDQKIDGLNPRTASRHLPAGVLSRAVVMVFTLVSSVGFLGGTLLFLPGNRLPLYAAGPVLLFLLGYSFAKRFTWLAHFWLGAALALAPLAAWVAIRAELAWPPVVLGAAVMFWVAGFDVIYACQDVVFDKQAGLRSIPVRLGVAGSLRLAAALHFVTVALLAALPLVYPAFGWIYGLGVAGIFALLVYEHWLVRPDDLSRVNRAFFQVNVVISLGLLVVGTIDLLI